MNLTEEINMKTVFTALRIFIVTLGITTSPVWLVNPALSLDGDSVKVPAFTDVGQSAGVADPGWGRGVAFGDYDNDGDLDIYLTNGRHRSTDRLYRNNGDGTFTDVGQSAGVADPGWGRGIAFGDCDNDGDLDIYLVNMGENRLYRNNGDGTFTDVAASAGVDDNTASAEMHDSGVGGVIAFGDYDQDGDLDIYLAPEGMNRLYRNNGDGSFIDVGQSAGVADTGDGNGVAFGDYDNDGDLDIYLANNRGGPNRLYRNNGDGSFIDVGQSAGVADTGWGQGIAFGDYDNDGDLDIYLANTSGGPNRLYRNNRDGTFTDVAAMVGVADTGNGNGVAFGDYDNDGDLDIYLVNAGLQPNRLYRNNGDGSFTDVGQSVGVADTGGGNGVAFGDYDNDGDLDIYVVNGGYFQLSNNRLYQNNQNDPNFLFVRPLDAQGRFNRHGAVVRVFEAGTGALVGMRTIDSGSSMASQNAYDAHFGLPSTGTYDIEVTFPGGIVQTLTDVPANQRLTVTEGMIAPIGLKDKIANPGAPFSMNISVRLSEALHHFSFDLKFDPSVLQAVSVKEGPLLSRDGADATSWEEPQLDNNNGVITNIQCRRMGIDGIAESVGVLAVVNFKAIKMGHSNISVQNRRLLTPSGEEIDAPVRAGSVAIFPHGSISGVVIDAEKQIPLSGAKIEASKDGFFFGLSTYSDDEGKYTLEGVPIGDLDVTAFKFPYLQTTTETHVKRGEMTSNLDFGMKPLLSSDAQDWQK